MAPGAPCYQSRGGNPLRFAVISDIHNNLEAFKTALVDIERQNVDKIYCLGDLLGYGPNPIECVDRMLRLRKEGILKVCLLGNHDQAIIFDPEGFNMIAEAAVFWSRERLEAERGPKAMARLDFIGELPRIFRQEPFLFVHGSPRNPLSEYVFPEDKDDKEKMAKLFSLVPQYCFIGHTHVPGVFVDRSGSTDYQYLSFKEIQDNYDCRYPLGEQKLIVNVGSVGQPRDSDSRLCYAIVQYDENETSNNHIEYRRIRYNVEKTIADIEGIPELSCYDFLMRRLRDGK